MAQEEEVAAGKAAQADVLLELDEKPDLFKSVMIEMSMAGFICGGAYLATFAILGAGYFPPLLGVLFGIVGAPLGLAVGAFVGLFTCLLLVAVLEVRPTTKLSSGAVAACVALGTGPLLLVTLDLSADYLVRSIVHVGRVFLMLLVIQTTALTVALNDAGFLRPTKLSSFLLWCADVIGRRRFVACLAGGAGLLGSVLAHILH